MEYSKKIICYHGTNNLFEKFDYQYLKDGSFGNGFYITTNPDIASEYGKYILKCEFMFNNPYQFGNEEQANVLKGELKRRRIEIVFDGDTFLCNPFEATDYDPRITDIIKGLGYDCLQPFVDEYVAFYSKQLKIISVINY